jgi:broad specificity phosphatase PhoE
LRALVVPLRALAADRLKKQAPFSITSDPRTGALARSRHLTEHRRQLSVQLPRSLDCRIIQIMTAHIRYLTHPQVQIDPAVPVPSWGLSAVGRTRAETLAIAGWLSGTTQIISSGERKAIETAEIIGGKLNVSVEVREAMHENDRSATGYLPPAEFETVANQFFTHPLVSIRGWERAIDAQLRIVREVEHVLARNQPGDVLFVGHGAVGTLLFCHYSGFAIDRACDQPASGGHYFAFVKDGRRVLHPWRRLEDEPYK